MMEITAAISIASSAYRGIQNAVNAGREAHDLAQTFSKFFDEKKASAKQQSKMKMRR